MLPLLILGSLGVVGGVMALFLPETLDKDLPQTLADGEQFGRNQRFFEFPCCNRCVVDSDFGTRSVTGDSLVVRNPGLTTKQVGVTVRGM